MVVLESVSLTADMTEEVAGHDEPPATQITSEVAVREETMPIATPILPECISTPQVSYVPLCPLFDTSA